MWIARAKAGAPPAEYALDYIVERKSVADVIASVKGGGRYEKQKYCLRRCGLRRLMYLIEGVPEAEVAGVRGWVADMIAAMMLLANDTLCTWSRLF